MHKYGYVNGQRYLGLATIVWLVAVPWLMWPLALPELTGLLLVTLLVLRFVSPRVIPETALNPFLFFYLFFVAAAFLLTPVPAVGLSHLTVTALGVFGFWLIHDWVTIGKGQSHLVVLFGSVGAAVAALVLLLTRIPGVQLVRLGSFAGLGLQAPGDFAIDADLIGGTLLILAPFALGAPFAAARLWPTARWRHVLFLAPILVGVGFVLAPSPAALIGLAVAGLAWYVWGRSGLGTVFVYLLVIVLLMPLAMVAVGDADGPLVAALTEVGLMPAGASLAWLARLEIWRSGLEMLSDYAVFGAGLNAFVPVSRAHFAYEFAAADANLTHAHNLFLQTAIGLGWAGLMALVGLLGTVAYGTWAAARRKPRRWSSPSRIYGAAIAGYLAFGIFDVISLGQRPAVLLWLVLGGGSALLIQREVRMNTPVWWRLAPLLVVVVLLLTPLLPQNLDSWREDQIEIAGRVDPALELSLLYGDEQGSGLVEEVQGETGQALRQSLAKLRADVRRQARTVESAVTRVAEALPLEELNRPLEGDWTTFEFWRQLLFWLQD